MTWQYPLWTMQQAQAIGYPIWDLYYDSWGFANGNPITVNGQTFPNGTTERADLTSVFGMAIGPRSTAGRVAVDYTLPTPVISGGVIPVWVDGLRTLDFYTCGVGMPLLTGATGPLTIQTTMPLFGALAADPSQYYPDGAALAAFPFADVELPALHLQFLLKNTPQVLIPIVRAPMVRQRLVVGAGAGAEALSRGYPVQGRRKAQIQFRVSAGTVSFRVGGLSYGGNPNEPLIERTLGTAAGVTGTASANVTLDLNHEFLMVYRTVTAGPADFQVDLLITD